MSENNSDESLTTNELLDKYAPVEDDLETDPDYVPTESIEEIEEDEEEEIHEFDYNYNSDDEEEEETESQRKSNDKGKKMLSKTLQSNFFILDFQTTGMMSRSIRRKLVKAI